MGYYPGRMALLRGAWGGRCVACSASEPLEFAHLPGKCTGVERARSRHELGFAGRGLPQRYHDVRNRPECYVLLCQGCHRAFDAGKEIG